MEESRIVHLYWARSEHAITETAIKYGKYCYAIANNILQNVEEADESVNDTYLGAWNSMPPHRPSILRTYLGKITRHLSLKKLRDMNRDKRGGGEVALALEELEECVPSKATVEEEIISAELSEIINCFVAKLPETERRVFLSRYWYLDSIMQISLDFHFSNSKVKSMLHRTRKKLLFHLKQEEVL